MILLDPDLNPDQSKQRQLPKRSGRSVPTDIPRNSRIPSASTLARFLRNSQYALKLRGQVTVLLTTDSAIRRLNRQFRGKNKATDVLSFPASDFAQVSRNGRSGTPERIVGDLAISIPTARRQAEERGHTVGVEIKILMLHGLLHLAGYDHETDNGTMARREQKLRATLKLPHGLIERISRQDVEKLPPGAKAHPHFEAAAARLKSCPDTELKSSPDAKQPGAPSISRSYRGMGGKQQTSAPEQRTSATVRKKGGRP